LADHPLVASIDAPLRVPHSRWNDLPAAALTSAGYVIIGWSADAGVHAFVKHAQRSQRVFLQGHPEYDPRALLKEYRRDIGRYLGGQQARYPDMPLGYFTPEAVSRLDAFRAQAMQDGTADLLSAFPFAAVAECLAPPWRAASIGFYQNWLAGIASRKQAGMAQLSH
jgi:homoserine O-succinyltransferase